MVGREHQFGRVEGDVKTLQGHLRVGGNKVALGGLLGADDGHAGLEGRLEGHVGLLALLGAAVDLGGSDELLVQHLGLEDGAVDQRAHAEGLGLLALLVEVGLIVGRGLKQFLGAGVVERLDAVVDDAVLDGVGWDTHGVVWVLVLGVGGKVR